MKIHLRKYRRNRQEYDWVLSYLQSHISLTPSQFLWSRIRAHLLSSQKEHAVPSDSGFMIAGVWRWAYPLIFFLSLSLGAYIGFKFADDYKNYNEPDRIYQLEPIPPEFEMPIDNGLDKQ